MSFSQQCDIGEYLRRWLLDIPEVRQFVGGDEEAIVDTIPEKYCKPFIWYSQLDASDSECFEEGFDDFDYALEIIAGRIYLAETRRIKQIIMRACQNYQRGDAFGDPNMKIQSLEIIRLRDGYAPAVINYLDIAFSDLIIQITP